MFTCLRWIFFAMSTSRDQSMLASERGNKSAKQPILTGFSPAGTVFKSKPAKTVERDQFKDVIKKQRRSVQVGV